MQWSVVNPGAVQKAEPHPQARKQNLQMITWNLQLNELIQKSS